MKGDDGKWKQVYAHRLAWALHNGADPSGFVVMHLCDNPPCVNPDHLRLGTYLENNRDCMAKGRARKARGRDKKRTILCESQIPEIRRLLETPLSTEVIGVMFNVSGRAIRSIKSGTSWRWVK